MTTRRSNKAVMQELAAKKAAADCVGCAVPGSYADLVMNWLVIPKLYVTPRLTDA